MRKYGCRFLTQGAPIACHAVGGRHASSTMIQLWLQDGETNTSDRDPTL